MVAGLGLEPRYDQAYEACELPITLSRSIGGPKENRTLTRSVQDYSANHYHYRPIIGGDDEN